VQEEKITRKPNSTKTINPFFAQPNPKPNQHKRSHLDHVGGPLVELEHPVAEGGERHNHKKGAEVLFRLHQIRKQSDRLDGLAQAHLVGENTVELVVVPASSSETGEFWLFFMHGK
jgi:hypothetical protein